MKRAVALASMLVAAAQADQKGTHLDPLPDRKGWDVTSVRETVFSQAFTSATVAWMAREGAFLPSSEVTALQRTKTGYRVVHMHVGTVLIRYVPGSVRLLGAPAPRDSRTLKPSRCAIDIPDALGARILNAFRAVLRRTRDDGERRRGADGETFAFSARDGASERRGTVWSPDGDTEPGMLAQVADGMSALCTTGLRRRVADIESGLDRLEHHLRQETAK